MSGIMITGADNMAKFRALQIVHALALEVGTGMQISRHGSALKAAKMQGIVPATCRTKKGALKLAVEYMKTLDPTYEPKGSVKLALTK
jgi:hypothetical protein